MSTCCKNKPNKTLHDGNKVTKELTGESFQSCFAQLRMFSFWGNSGIQAACCVTEVIRINLCGGSTSLKMARTSRVIMLC